MNKRTDDLYEDFCANTGLAMDSDKDREDFRMRGHLFPDGGSDVHDGLKAP